MKVRENRIHKIYLLSGLSQGTVTCASSGMRFRFLFLVVIGLMGCGPDLSTPSSKSVSGKWQSSDPVSFFFNIKLDLAQAQNGEVTGTWTSLYKGGNLSCPEGQICPASNDVAGRNTVVGVSIEVLGIGKFTGQLEGDSVLRGDIYRYDGDFNVKFTKIP